MDMRVLSHCEICNRIIRHELSGPTGTVKLTSILSFCRRNMPTPQRTIKGLEPTGCSNCILKSVNLTIPIPDGPDVARRIHSAREVSHQVGHRSTVWKLRKQCGYCFVDELARIVVAGKTLRG